MKKTTLESECGEEIICFREKDKWQLANSENSKLLNLEGLSSVMNANLFWLLKSNVPTWDSLVFS